MKNIRQLKGISIHEVDAALGIANLTQICNADSTKAGWWSDLHTGKTIEVTMDVKLAKIMLAVTELSEAVEGERKNLMDDKLPHRPMAEVELADAVIRICDYAGKMGYDLGGAIIEKIHFNRKRPDHKIANRRKKNGKKI